MSNQPPDDTDDLIEDVSTETSTLSATAITSPYKVLGEFDADNGVGVLGQNNADSGTPIGVQGAVPNNPAGFGLATPHDARVEGDLEATNGHTLTVGKERTLRLGPTATETDSNGNDFTVAGDLVAGYEKNTAIGATGATIAGGGADNRAGTSGSSMDAYANVAGGVLEHYRATQIDGGWGVQDEFWFWKPPDLRGQTPGVERRKHQSSFPSN